VRTVPGVGLYFSCLNYLQFLTCGTRKPTALQYMLLGGRKTEGQKSRETIPFNIQIAFLLIRITMPSL
jgi:hypothetical protein